jgi:hypothetical protein
LIPNYGEDIQSFSLLKAIPSRAGIRTSEPTRLDEILPDVMTNIKKRMNEKQRKRGLYKINSISP